VHQGKKIQIMMPTKKNSLAGLSPSNFRLAISSFLRGYHFGSSSAGIEPTCDAVSAVAGPDFDAALLERPRDDFGALTTPDILEADLCTLEHGRVNTVFFQKKNV
jgi:hypothetical protein